MLLDQTDHPDRTFAVYWDVKHKENFSVHPVFTTKLMENICGAVFCCCFFLLLFFVNISRNTYLGVMF